MGQEDSMTETGEFTDVLFTAGMIAGGLLGISTGHNYTLMVDNGLLGAGAGLFTTIALFSALKPRLKTIV
jgi:hypothetical protein